ncbi:hypothetical protein HUU40_29015 [candidate division KSB1 bacterium]|nr:hypothetical protein [candidate division KSB1 bacterium]
MSKPFGAKRLNGSPIIVLSKFFPSAARRASDFSMPENPARALISEKTIDFLAFDAYFRNTLTVLRI